MKSIYYSLIMFSRHPTNDSSKLHQFVSFDVVSYVPFLCLKLYSLNYAIAHMQKKIVMLIRTCHTCVASKHKKTD